MVICVVLAVVSAATIIGVVAKGKESISSLMKRV